MNDEQKLNERKNAAAKKQKIDLKDLANYEYNDDKKEWTLKEVHEPLFNQDKVTGQGSEGNSSAESFENEPGADDLDFNDENYEAAFAQGEKSEGTALTGEFKFLNGDDLEKGVQYNYLVTGKTTIPDNLTKEPRPVVKLKDRNKDEFLCGLAVVVSAVDKMTKIPGMIRIINKGKKPGKKYYDIDVFEL